MLVWTKFQSPHSHNTDHRPLFIFDPIYILYRIHTRTHASTVATISIETPLCSSCMFHVHSFINKFSHYRSFGDDFLLSSSCSPAKSNHAMLLMVNHLRWEPKKLFRRFLIRCSVGAVATATVATAAVVRSKKLNWECDDRTIHVKLSMAK